MRKWQNEGITQVSCFVVSRGCAGKKIEVTQGKNVDCTLPLQINENLICWIKGEEKDILDYSYLTASGNGWLLKSDQINTRCGCSKSFSLKTGDTKIDKIAVLRLRLKQSQEGIHI